MNEDPKIYFKCIISLSQQDQYYGNDLVTLNPKNINLEKNLVFIIKNVLILLLLLFHQHQHQIRYKLNGKILMNQYQLQ